MNDDSTRISLNAKKPIWSNSAEKGSHNWNFWILTWFLCQVEGHGETLSKFSLKFTKNFPRQIWKIFSGFIYLRPLYRNMTLIWLDTQWERLWHFWTTVIHYHLFYLTKRLWRNVKFLCGSSSSCWTEPEVDDWSQEVFMTWRQ